MKEKSFQKAACNYTKKSNRWSILDKHKNALGTVFNAHPSTFVSAFHSNSDNGKCLEIQFQIDYRLRY